MSISPSIFLIIYAVLFGVFLIISILNFYHIIRFGIFKRAGIIVTFIYLGVIVIIVGVTFVALGDIEWRQSFEINLPFIDTYEGIE